MGYERRDGGVRVRSDKWEDEKETRGEDEAKVKLGSANRPRSRTALAVSIRARLGSFASKAKKEVGFLAEYSKKGSRIWQLQGPRKEEPMR